MRGVQYTFSSAKWYYLFLFFVRNVFSYALIVFYLPGKNVIAFLCPYLPATYFNRDWSGQKQNLLSSKETWGWVWREG